MYDAYVYGCPSCQDAEVGQAHMAVMLLSLLSFELTIVEHIAGHFASLPWLGPRLIWAWLFH